MLKNKLNFTYQNRLVGQDFEDVKSLVKKLNKIEDDVSTLKVTRLRPERQPKPSTTNKANSSIALAPQNGGNSSGRRSRDKIDQDKVPLKYYNIGALTQEERARLITENRCLRYRDTSYYARNKDKYPIGRYELSSNTTSTELVLYKNANQGNSAAAR